MTEFSVNFKGAFTGTGSGTMVSNDPVGLTGSSPGPIPVTGLSFTLGDSPWTVDMTAIPDPGSVFIGWTSSDDGFGDMTPAGPVANNPQQFTFTNVDSVYTITAEFALAPCPPITVVDDGPFDIFLDEPMDPITLIPQGGTAPYSFDVDPDWDACPAGLCPGATLPPGLTIGASTGIISGTPTAGSPCQYVPIKITDDRGCIGYACIQLVVSARPAPVCYELTPCSGDKDQVPIVVTNDLAIYIGQVIQILGQCYTVSLAISCVGSVTLNNPVISGPFIDCCDCDPDPVYELIDCSLQNPSILTTTDMSQYVGQTIKVCEFVSNPTIGIAGVPTACQVGVHIGFITQITGPNSGYYYDPNTGTIDPYLNPLNFPLELGDQICVNDIIIAPAFPIHNVLQHVGGTYLIQFFIGTTPITNQITVNPGMSITDLQWFINQQIIYPNTTIVVNTFDIFNNLEITVTISEAITETEVNVIVTPPTSVPPAYPPTSTVTVDITGDCICYDVIDAGEICDILPAFTGIVSGVFDDCVCCNPPPEEEPEPYVPTIPEIDKHTYKVTESQCDIDANKTFANAMYDKFKTDQYGMESCCPRNFNQIWIQKELSDLSKINC